MPGHCSAAFLLWKVATGTEHWGDEGERWDDNIDHIKLSYQKSCIINPIIDGEFSKSLNMFEAYCPKAYYANTMNSQKHDFSRSGFKLIL